MHTSPHPTMTTTAAPRLRIAPDRPPPATDPLASAVDAGLERLRNLTVSGKPSPPDDLEHRLRTALNTSQPARPGYTSARVACAHLAAGDLTEAYFALLVARDQLLSIPLSTGSPSGDAGTSPWSARGQRAAASAQMVTDRSPAQPS